MNTATRTAELAKATRNDPRWALIVARDALVDRMFYYSVKTTGVYCRPSVPPAWRGLRMFSSTGRARKPRKQASAPASDASRRSLPWQSGMQRRLRRCAE
jgi:hypothetical protein